ncbi:MFS transporter [Natronomonas sp. EA1]|uniref:MFS transporter n=1 Tax=Natronomonas sp. EA1 TaxID=3421655 RepID=UPI003EB74AC5
MKRRLQFLALYLTRFAGGFGLVTLATLLPRYIDLFNPDAFLLGMFTTGFTLAQALVVVPLAWWGDAGDKKRVLQVSLALALLSYAVFYYIGDGAGLVLLAPGVAFVAARALQGAGATGTSLITLSLVGDLSGPAERANRIGKANAARFAAGIGGGLSAGVLYEAYGFETLYTVLVALFALALLGVTLFVQRDEERISGFPFTALALSDRIRALTVFRAQYAVSVTLVRTWVPIFAGVTAAKGGLAYGAVAVAVVLTAEKAANMLCQPHTGRLSDRFGRALFVFGGGLSYGVVALVVPFTTGIGTALGLPPGLPGAEWLAGTAPVVALGGSTLVAGFGTLTPAFLPLVACNALLGVADAFREPASMALFADEGADAEGGGVAASFGIRELVWRPGSVVAPLLGGFLMTDVGMAWVFYVGALTAFTAAVGFLGVLRVAHGDAALTSW